MDIPQGYKLSRHALRARDAKRIDAEDAKQNLTHMIEEIARLSVIDGAVLAGPELQVYGAGYLIPTEGANKARILQALTAAFENRTHSKPYTRIHGARHSAAIAFAYREPGGVAFVVSEDGPISCMLRVNNDVIVWPVRVPET